MKGRISTFLRAIAPLAGLVIVAGPGVTGCGSDSKTNPTSVSLKDLKSASGLRIVDLGNGAVRLFWSGSNNESSFSGYNVYGKKGGADAPPIKLLDDNGEPVTEGKAALEGMSYNGKDWESVGTPVTPKEKGDYSFTPYHTANDAEGNAVVPTCQPTGATDATFGLGCTVLASDTVPETKLNGRTYLDLTGLKPGATYCFTVLATMDDGEKGAQTTSEVKCVTPRAVAANQTFTAACKQGQSEYSVRFDLKALRAACATGTCGNIATTVTSGDCTADTTDGTACFEIFKDPADPTKPNLTFTSTSLSGVQDVGYYSGFSDLNLRPAPRLAAVGDVQSKDGYTSSGQSLRTFANHVFAFAEVDGTSTYYHFARINTQTPASTCSASETSSITMEWRVGLLAGAR